MKKLCWFMVLMLCLSMLGAAVAEGDPALFTDPEIGGKIDEAAAEAREQGWSELRIPQSVHGIGREAISANALEAGQKLLDAGYQAYLVGGAVRDMLLGMSINDFDISSDAPLELEQTLFGEALSTHGVEGSRATFALVHFEDGEDIDLAPLRNVETWLVGQPGVPETDSDSITSDSPLFDTYSRDLTINAFYYDLSSGDILDFHGGLSDLRDHILRTIGDPDLQLRNTPSRMLRYMRFLARYEDFTLAPDLEEALQEHKLEYAALTEPLAAENQLRRFWNGGYAAECFDVMLNYGLLGYYYAPVAELCNDEAYRAGVRAALAELDAAHARGETVDPCMGTAVIVLPAVRARLDAMTPEEAAQAVLTEMESTYGFYGAEKDETARLILDLLSQQQAEEPAPEAEEPEAEESDPEAEEPEAEEPTPGTEEPAPEAA